MGQNKLYVFKQTANHSTIDEIDCYIDDLQYGYRYTYGSGEYDVNTSTIQIAIDYRIGYNDDPSNGCNGPCGGFGWFCDPNSNFPTNNSSLDYNNTISLFEEVNIIYDGPANLTCNDLASDCLPLDYKAIFIPETTQPADNTRCIKEKLYATYNGESRIVNDLRWQYLNDANQPLTIPNLSNRYPLDATVEEIFGTDYTSYFSGPLRLFYEVGSGLENVAYSSDLFTFNINQCTPEITNVDPQNELCGGYDTPTGGFTLYFERALEPGEELTDMSLKRVSDNVTVDAVGSPVVYTGTTYEWPNPVPAGNYYVDYQLNYTGSQVQQYDFFITAPTPVSFSAVGSNLSCFEDGSGSITINASGGVGSYQYSLDNGLTYLPFVNSNTHTASGLDATIPYLVKVKDLNGCTQQN